MIETIQISSINQFNDWKVKKLRKDWQASTIRFICEICKKEINIKGRNFKDFICRSCRKSNTETKKSVEQKQQELQKRKETLTRRYGTGVLMKIPGVAEKCKQIFLEKYGVENPSQSKEVQEKIKQINTKRYGYASTNQVPFIKEKQNKGQKKAWNHKSAEEKRLMRLKACKKYIYKEQSFDSSWELALWVYAKDHALNIEREPVILEYIFENRKCRYFPDFLFEGKLVEIKGPQFFKKDGTMQNPFNHEEDTLFEAKHQCGLEHDVQFWGKKDIQFALTYMKEIYGKGWPELFQKKS